MSHLHHSMDHYQFLFKRLTMTNDGSANEHTVRKINFGAGPAQLPVEV